MIPHLRRAELLGYLAKCQIEQKTVDHPAIFTVDEGRDIKTTMVGGHSKNLFLRDKKKIYFLAVAHVDTRIDLVALGKVIGARGRLSFGAGSVMEEMLGVSPGSVTPFAMINDRDHAISKVILDKNLMMCNPVWFHPLENTASTAVSPDGLLEFFKSLEIEPIILDLAKPGED